MKSSSSALWLLGMLLWQPQQLTAQRFRVFRVSSTSSHPELSNSSGLGLWASLPLPWAVHLDLGWRSVEDASVRNEDICLLYNPRQLCEQGVATRETTLWTISGGVGRRLELTPRLAVIPAVSVTLGTLKQRARSSTRFPPDTVTPASSQMGGVGILEVAVRPLPSLPLELSLAGASQWVLFNGCAREVDVYAPFCGMSQFWELQFGAAFVR